MQSESPSSSTILPQPQLQRNYANLSSQDHAAASALHSLSSPPADTNYNFNFFNPSTTSPVRNPSNDNNNQSQRSLISDSPTMDEAQSLEYDSQDEDDEDGRQPSYSQSQSLPLPPAPTTSTTTTGTRNRKGKEKVIEKAPPKGKGKQSKSNSISTAVSKTPPVNSINEDEESSNKRKKASRACAHCQKSHLTCEDGESLGSRSGNRG